MDFISKLLIWISDLPVETVPLPDPEQTEVTEKDNSTECGSPAKSALQLLAEIDKDNDKQDQNSMKNALELLDEIETTQCNEKQDQDLDVFNMDAITMDSEDEEADPTLSKCEKTQEKDISVSHLKVIIVFF